MATNKIRRSLSLRTLIIATSYLAVNQSGSIRGDPPIPSADTKQPLPSQVALTQPAPSRTPKPQKVRKTLLAQMSPVPEPTPVPSPTLSQKDISKMLFAQVSPAPTPTPNAPAEPDQTPNAERIGPIE